MKCRAKTKNNTPCTKKAEAKYLFLWCHIHRPFGKVFWEVFWWLVSTIAGGFVTYFVVDKVIENRQPFTAIVHITDWNDRDNQDIYNKGGTIIFDNKYTQPMNETGIINFPDLPSSYVGKDIQVRFIPKLEYRFMQLKTTIKIQREQTYNLKMYFEGIDKITRKVIDEEGKPIIGAIAEVKGIKDTTDAEGIFTITLPLKKQERIQKLTIKKEGYQDYSDNKLDMTLNDSTIMLKKE